MSIVRIDYPNPAPVGISDWEDIIDVAEFLALGVGNPVDYDFSSNTIKQGVQILIGGSVYQSTTATAITGTPSDYVKITPAGATASAAYVASLAGVTWNSVYNHYEDGSGNAYLFNEAKAELVSPKTVVGAFAEDAYIGTLTTRGQTILARDGGTVDSRGNIIITKASPSLQLIDSGANSRRLILQATDSLTSIDTSFGGGGPVPLAFEIAGIEVMRYSSNLNLLLGTTVDSGPRLVVADGVGSLPSIGTATVGLFQNNSASGDHANLLIVSGITGQSRLRFGDADSGVSGSIIYDNSADAFDIYTAGGQAIRITAVNHLLVNTTSDPGEGLHVGAGGMRVTGTTHPFIVKSTGFLDDTWMDGTLYVNTIAEKTAAAGVTIDSVLLKDNTVTATSIITNTITEKTAGTNINLASLADFTKGVKATNILHDDTATGNEIFDILAPFIPVIGDKIKVNGGISDSTDSWNISYVIRQTEFIIGIFGLEDNFSASATNVTDESATSYHISISW